MAVKPTKTKKGKKAPTRKSQKQIDAWVAENTKDGQLITLRQIFTFACINYELWRSKTLKTESSINTGNYIFSLVRDQLEVALINSINSAKTGAIKSYLERYIEEWNPNYQEPVKESDLIKIEVVTTNRGKNKVKLNE